MCIFCKIINGYIPSNKVFENQDFICILDAFPANIGHTLVIPKHHYKDVFDIPSSILKDGFILAQNIAKALHNGVSVSDINILQNNGLIAGQTVNHFHIHVIPRYIDDKVIIKSSPINMTDDDIINIKNILLDKLS